MKSENVAHFNNKLIVNLLLQEPLSCVELAEKTNLSHMATGRILRRLLEMDIVKPYVEPQKKRGRGRQFCRYEINSERAYFVCINFRHKNGSIIIYNLAGEPIHTDFFETKKVDNEIVDSLIENIKVFFNETGFPFDRIAVVSVAIPGRVNDKSGEIIVSSKIDKSVNLRDKMAKAFPSAIVTVKNDIDYACIYSILSDEFDYGEGTHLYLYVGIGVACCAVMNKTIICGTSGFGGEIGMNTIDKEGNRLHAAVSTEEMLAFCRIITGNKDFSLSDMKKACGDYPEIKNKLIEVAETLGRAVCNHVDLLGASHIVFAGPITDYPQFFFDVFLKKLKDTNYSDGIDYKMDFSYSEETGGGQMLLARLNALDWVMKQY